MMLNRAVSGIPETAPAIVNRRMPDGERPVDDWLIIDTHVHPKTSEAELIADLDAAGIRYAVILATETDPDDTDRPEIARWIEETYFNSSLRYEASLETIRDTIRRSLRSPTHVDNDRVAELAARFPDRLIPFGSVNPCKPREEFEQQLHRTEELGVKGIKLLPYSQFFDPSACENAELLMEHCRRLRIPILCHTGCAAGIFEVPEFSRNSRPSLWDDLLTRYPDVNIIFAHFGAYSADYPGIWMGEAMEMMKKHENAFTDLAAVTGLLLNDALVRFIRKETGFDRVLYGSDYPMPRYVPGGSQQDVVGMIREMDVLTEKEKRGILGENAARLLQVSR